MVVTWRWLLIEAFVAAARKVAWNWPAGVTERIGFVVAARWETECYSAVVSAEFVAAARLATEH